MNSARQITDDTSRYFRFFGMLPDKNAKLSLDTFILLTIQVTSKIVSASFKRGFVSVPQDMQIDFMEPLELPHKTFDTSASKKLWLWYKTLKFNRIAQLGLY